MRHSANQATEIKALRSLLDRSTALLMVFASTAGCGEKNRALANSLRDEYLAIAKSKADGRRKK